MRGRIGVWTLGIGDFAQQDSEVEKGIEDGDGGNENHGTANWTQPQQSRHNGKDEGAVEQAKHRRNGEGLQEDEEGGGGQEDVLQSPHGIVHGFIYGF